MIAAEVEIHNDICW